MNILAIETSCDETAVALIDARKEGDGVRFSVLGDALYSQATLHSAYGGVFPSLAKREHQHNLVPLTREALRQAGMYERTKGAVAVPEEAFSDMHGDEFIKTVREFLETTEKPDIDLVAATYGPGLEPALWTGVTFARALAAAWEVPLAGINHMEGHVFSALTKKEDEHRYLLPPVGFPVLSLLISGGHTELVLAKEWFRYELVGKTRDDAVGEAFDKVARLLGLPYPGGPEIAREAASARENGERGATRLPRPMLGDPSCDFSFSGLKTAVLYLVRDMKELSEKDKRDIAAEFEDAVRDVLVSKTKRALQETGARTLVVGGGVAANAHIKEGLSRLLEDGFPDVSLHTPPPDLTGDNAVMIGIAAGMRTLTSMLPDDKKTLAARGSLGLAS